MNLPTDRDPVLIVEGNCLDVMPTLPSESFDAVVTDPPFGIAYQNQYTHAKHDVVAGDGGRFDYSAFSAECIRLLRPGGAFFAYTGWSEYPDHYRQVEAVGFKMKEPLIVQKRPAGSTGLASTFQPNADWLIFAVKGDGFAFRPTQLVKNKRAGTVPNKGRKPVPDFKTRFPSAWFGDGFPFSTENPSTLAAAGLSHPFAKSVEFLSWLIQLITDAGGLVLDPFCGIGSTQKAAGSCGRRSVGIEIDKGFAGQAMARLAAEAAKGGAA